MKDQDKIASNRNSIIYQYLHFEICSYVILQGMF